MKEIICKVCNKKIISEKDLVVANRFMRIKPYHTSCYSNSLKSLIALTQPINGKAFTYLSLFGPALILVLLNYPSRTYYISAFMKIILILISFLPLSLRIYSLYKFEKPLKIISKNNFNEV